ncbi:MAG: cyclase family protein [Chloroflexi bacterium]|nr:cyclase family protein [Chloroflexota bacterium]
MTTHAAPALLDALRARRLVDLSPPLVMGMPGMPRALPYERTVTATLAERGVNTGRIALSEHHGAHFDAPVHFIEGGRTMSEVPLTDLVVEAVVIDCAASVASDPEHRLTVAEVAAWEQVHDPVPERAWVLLRTGWLADRWSDPARYANADADGVLRHPALHPDAARLLVERGIGGVGIDTLSVDNAAPSDIRSPSHKVLHGADRYVMENLANLEQLPPRDILLFIGALPVVDGTAGPARVLASIPAG